MDFTFLKGYPAPGKVSGLCLGGKALPSPDAEPIEMLLVHTTAILGEPPPPPIAATTRRRTPASSTNPLYPVVASRLGGQPSSGQRRIGVRFSHISAHHPPPLAGPAQGAICSFGRPS